MAEKLHFWQMTPFNELKSEIFYTTLWSYSKATFH